VIGHGLDDRGIGVRVIIESKFSLLHVSRLALGLTQSTIQWATGAIFPEVKCPGSEVDHSFPLSAEVKKCGSVHPLPY
jgi:hypothetical protein